MVILQNKQLKPDCKQGNQSITHKSSKLATQLYQTPKYIYKQSIHYSTTPIRNKQLLQALSAMPTKQKHNQAATTQPAQHNKVQKQT